MGTYGKKIIELDTKKLIELLNKAYADEWLAYYQYWLGAKLAHGKARSFVVAELNEHANDELEHASLLADRIVQLGGEPLLDPKDWYEYSDCKYRSPVNPDTLTLLKQNIKAEQCAIEVYKKLIDYVRGKDDITYGIILHILQEEVEHEDELEAILQDIA